MTRSERPERPLALTTALTLVAFAANSVLCRVALGGHAIDAASFTTIRILSGAALLTAVVPRGARGADRGSWTSAITLIVYAVPFSFAYLSLSAGTGALILFGAVQTTMIGAACLGDSRPRAAEMAGVLAATVGLVYLVWPGVTAPPLVAATLMAVAGVAWGLYSLQGRTARFPAAMTAGNFVRTVPLTLLVSLAFAARVQVAPRGIILAAGSGAITSGLGYVAWYSVLPRLGAVTASSVQLMVPVLAAVGGVLFLGETVTPRLGLASVLVLGGIAVAIGGRRRG
jgi:drug/metabolite transporter (DMT)-like permease